MVILKKGGSNAVLFCAMVFGLSTNLSLSRRWGRRAAKPSFFRIALAIIKKEGGPLPKAVVEGLLSCDFIV